MRLKRLAISRCTVTNLGISVKSDCAKRLENRREIIMLQFTVSSVASVVRPFKVEKEGAHSGDVESCWLNGVRLEAGDLVLVSGIIPSGSAIKVFREYGREFRGQEPQCFSWLMSSWYGSAGVEQGTPIHWDSAFRWDGLTLASVKAPETAQPIATIEV
jgi:hypothetical protein